MVRFWHGDLVGAHRAYEEMAVVAAELGDESSIPYVRVMLGQIDCALGRFHDAVREAEAGQVIAEQAGQRTLLGYLLAVRAVAEAHLGQADDASASAARALELAEATSGIPAWIFASWALGHLELSRGDAAAALARLEPLAEHHRREAIEEPGALPFVPDFVEALLEAGRLADAEEALDRYEAAATRLGRTRGLRAATRCRGLLAAAHGDVAAAIEELEAAVELAAPAEARFERARAQLALGAALRRSKRRREAREALELALTGFEEAGAALWAERTRAELARISGRAPASGELDSGRRARGRPRRRREDEPRGRGGALSLRAHRRGAPVTRLREARRALAHGARPRARRARTQGSHRVKHRGFPRFTRVLRSLASLQVATRVTGDQEAREMTPRISLITAVAALALVVGVPAAFGDNWGADRQSEAGVVGSPDREDRAILAQQTETRNHAGRS